MFSRFLTLLGLVWSLAVWASEGGGVGNGGSGYRCGSDAVVTSEYLFATRFAPTIHVADRDLFIARVLAKIKNQTFKDLLYRQWLKFGNSEFWPEGHLNDTTVYFYLSSRQPIAYSKEGLIAPSDPQNSICASPLYEPSKCCERALLSFFYPKSVTPTKLAHNFDELSRYQKNLLELHEAVYRLGFDLAKYPVEREYADINEDIARYRREVSPEMIGDLPSVQVMTLVSYLIRETPTQERDIELAIDAYWAWSKVTLNR